MGFLSVNGFLMTYEEYKHWQIRYKRHGIMQFCNLYHKHSQKKIEKKDLHWGEELEYAMFYFDNDKKRVQMACDASKIIPSFNEEFKDDENVHSFTLLPEYGNWMIEAVPQKPYGSYSEADQLLSCVAKLKYRRSLLGKYIMENGFADCKILSLTTSPQIGTGADCVMSHNPELQEVFDEAKQSKCLTLVNESTQSCLVPEATASPHPRFLGLAQSIRERRGEKVNIQVPLFMDKQTSLETSECSPYPGQIYMDAMHFGMGCCCLQLTYETQGIEHARYLYDMFIPFTAIMAAISAATPILRGKLSDHDLRWEIIEQSVDCRTKEERDPESSEYIAKSRYSTVSRYISNHAYVQDFHNDFILTKQKDTICGQYLEEAGIDSRLSSHISSLFLRSPVPAYEKEFMFPCCGHQQIIPKRASLQQLQSSKSHHSLGIKKVHSQTAALSHQDLLAQQTPITTVKKSALLAKGSGNKHDNDNMWFDETDPVDKIELMSDGPLEEKKGDSPQANSVCMSCSELNQIDPDYCDTEEINEAIKKGVFTKWWTKIPPVDGNSHFENLQSTNWNSLRFKPPPSVDSHIGWRVEFRPMDIQLTDFENAALTIFVGMIANIVNYFDVDYVLPISLVDQNFQTAHLRDALLTQKFWWKANAVKRDESGKPRRANLEENVFVNSGSERQKSASNDEQHLYQQVFIWQVLLGDAAVGIDVGLIELMHIFMQENGWTAKQIEEASTYLSFLAARSKGQVPTGARFLRDFVQAHPGYKQDSIVSGEMIFDLCKMVANLEDPDSEPRRILLGEFAKTDAV